VNAIYTGGNRTKRCIAAGFVSVVAAALLAGCSATAAPRAASHLTAQQTSSRVAGTYFGEARTTVGYIPGL
jgi:outer membrane biogenesis lipoprotein LolB